MWTYIEVKQVQAGGAATHRLPSIEYFRTPAVMPATGPGTPTLAAQEVLASPYWTGRIVQGLVESASGKRILLDDYLSNPG